MHFHYVIDEVGGCLDLVSRAHELSEVNLLDSLLEIGITKVMEDSRGTDIWLITFQPSEVQ